MTRPNDNLADATGVVRGVGLVSYDDSWTTALDVTLNVVAAYSSAAYDISSSTGAIVNVSILSTGAPTDMRLLAQFSHNDGDTWSDYEEGLWASLYWEDTDTAAVINKTFTLPCSGQDLLRFRVIGTGSGAQATFAVVVRFRAFRGGNAGAHA